MIRTESTSAAELRLGGCRLDGWYYSSDGARAWRLIASTGVSADALAALCVPSGLYIPHRFKRPYVRDPEYGIPYITGSSIGLADPLQNCAYLSSRPGAIPGRDSLMLKPGTILVTASGIPGVAVYANDLFAGTVGSPDLVRVIPDTTQVRAGYLYAFLSSPVGREMLARGTYGGVIPHIEIEHIADLPIPRLADPIEEAIQEMVESAAVKRVEANRKLEMADGLVQQVAGLPSQFSAPQDHAFATGEVGTGELCDGSYRLDAYHYIGYAGEIRHWESRLCPMISLCKVTVRVFEPPIFKRIRAEEGVPYLLGAEVYEAHPRPATKIAWHTANLDEYLLRRDMVVVEDAGQRYGLLGTPAYVGKTLAGCAATNNMIRLVCRTREDAGYLFALLRSQFGIRAIRRLSYGTSLPHILPKQVEDLGVPWPEDDSQRQRVAEPVLEAVGLRDEANDLEDEAQAMLERALDEATGGAWSKLARRD